MLERNVSRRHLLATAAAVVAVGSAVAGCATNATTGQPELNPAVIDFISNAVATAAKYLPSVESIASIAAALFGPGYATIVQIGSQAINTVISALISAVSNLTPPAQARLRAKLRATAPGLQVPIGSVRVTGPNGPVVITVVGTRVG